MFVKTFSLDWSRERSRRLETRLLVGERVLGNEDVGDQVWLGYTYLWNDAQTDAELIESKGAGPDVHDRRPESARRQARADLAFPEPDRVHALPHHVRQVCTRHEHAPGQP